MTAGAPSSTSAFTALDDGAPSPVTARNEPPVVVGRRVHALLAGLVVAFAAGLPLLVARHYGTLGVARGDDWSYLRTLFHWIDAGRLDFNHWVSMTLLGQLVLTAPLALISRDNAAPLQVATALLGVVGLLAVQWTAWTVTRRPVVAAFTALVVAAGPMWGILAVSYMTDVPAFAFSMLAMAIGVRALRDRTPALPWVFASIAVGYFAFTIREYAGVPAAAIAIVAGVRAWQENDRRLLRAIVVAAAVAAIGVVVFMLAWRTVPNGKSLSPSLPGHHSLATLVDKGGGMLRLAGLWLAPLLVLANPARIVRVAWRAHRVATVVAAAGIGSWLAITGLKLPRLGFAGNYFIPDGALGNGVSTGHRPLLIPVRWFEFLLIVGTLGAVLLALLLIPGLRSLIDMARRRRPRTLGAASELDFVAACAALYVLAYAAGAITGLPLYDRYTLPIVGFAGVLVARWIAERPTEQPAPRRVSERRLVGWSALAFAGVATVGALYTFDSASFDAVRWNVSEAAVHAGWPATRVGGNFEWVNFHTATPGTRLIRRAPCVAVVVGAQAVAAGRIVIARGAYRPPFHSPIPVAAVRTFRPCPPPSPPRH